MNFWIDSQQFNFAKFHQFIFDRHIDKLNEILPYCRDNPNFELLREASTDNFIFTIRAIQCRQDIVGCRNNLLGIQVTIPCETMIDCFDSALEVFDRGIEKFCDLISSTLNPVLDFWIRYDSIWEELQIDWRPSESIAEDYYV